jgi:hypothetical protein
MSVLLSLEMDFKKDYINYLLYSVGRGYSNQVPEQARVKKILHRILTSDDLVRAVYLIGKTAGLETLFKYLLYISDKIDKSQISMANLRDNFDYDAANLQKICEQIQKYRSPEIAGEMVSGETAEVSSPGGDSDMDGGAEPEIPEIPEVGGKEKGEIEEAEQEVSGSQIEDEEGDEKEEEEYSGSEESGLTLIDTGAAEEASAEVFELTPEVEGGEDVIEDSGDAGGQELETIEETAETTPLPSSSGESLREKEESEAESSPPAGMDSPAPSSPQALRSEKGESEEPEIEIEIRTPDQRREVMQEEPPTNEKYFEFETKFHEEVKILEKLFLHIYNEAKAEQITKLSGRLRKSFKQAIEITDELSNLTRELSFDLTADIFLTINLFFKKALGVPAVVTPERLQLLNSALVLVRNLIKGDNYLNYTAIVDKIEQLKNEMLRAKQRPAEKEQKTETQKEFVRKTSYGGNEVQEQQSRVESHQRLSASERTWFTMRWMVKDFEKVFHSLNYLTGEYSKFDALERCDELNNYLRLIARHAHSVKADDICRLAEVAYVFLKYVKDYRMDLLEPEVQQVVKYVIFGFKMLLMNRKPEDFEVLVEYLNNPVKIFTDS